MQICERVCRGADRDDCSARGHDSLDSPQWGPSPINRLVIGAGGPAINLPDVYRINAERHGLEPSIDDPHSLDRLAAYLRNMDEVIVSCQEQRVAWSQILKGSAIHSELVSSFALERWAFAITNAPTSRPCLSRPGH